MLIKILEKKGEDVDDLWAFVDLSAFAAQFRYQEFPRDTSHFQREESMGKAKELIDRVELIINSEY